MMNKIAIFFKKLLCYFKKEPRLIIGIISTTLCLIVGIIVYFKAGPPLGITFIVVSSLGAFFCIFAICLMFREDSSDIHTENSNLIV